ncbi:MAG: hypothetical protein KDD00_15430 [Ignavibacteriae bacterium]|nr:hypothetical protein [Ignavibacteriota bacterium]
MKAILLRVGIDSQYNALSPVWGDYTYKYIPIYYKDIKEKEKKEKRTYKDLGLEYYVPAKIRKKKVHLDPEFKTYTYGDPGRTKRSFLLNLNKGDLLVFYLGGETQEEPVERGCYIFGYFVVKKVYDWNKLTNKEKKDAEKICKENAHIRSSKSKDNLVIVKGSPASKLLKKCIPISDENKKSKNPSYLASEEMKKFIGIRDAITRAVPIVIEDEQYVKNLKYLLGISKFDPEEYEGKIPFTLFARIIDEERGLKANEKLYLKNFMMSKNTDYRSACDNFGLDVYQIGGYKNTELMEEYFMNYFKLL